jgi:oligopeptidase A
LIEFESKFSTSSNSNKKTVSLPTYSSTIEELEKIQAPLSYSWGVISHLKSVKDSPELRKVHEELQPEVIEIQQKLGQSLPVFQALEMVLQKEKKTLDYTQQRIIENQLLDMKFSGVNLQPFEKKEHFNQLQLELANLSTKFSNNILDSTKQFQLKIDKPTEIRGLPQSILSLLSENAKNNNEPHSTPEKGPWVITLDFPSYFPCMQHLKHRDIREKLYRAYMTRASNGEYDNAPIIQRILQIKLEMAQILGYSNYADRSLAKKMASNVKNVNNLIDMLREKSFPAAKKELEELQQFANDNGFDGKLQLW